MERTEILDLLAEGKIGVAEAADMLNALSKAAPSEAPAAEAPVAAAPAAAADDVTEKPVAKIVKIEVEEEEKADAPAAKSVEIEVEEAPETKSRANGGPKRLRILINEGRDAGRRVNITLPAGAIRFGARLGRQIAPDVDGLDWDEIDEILASGMSIEVDDANEHVKIVLE